MSSSSDKIWYVRKGIKKLGPFSNAEMRGLANSGKLVPEDMIWKDGLNGWVKASKLKGVFPAPVQAVQFDTPEEVPPTLTQTFTDLSNSQTESHNQLILLVTLLIGFVFALIGAGLLYSAGKNKLSTSTSASPTASSSKSSTLKSSKILGVRLGDNISTYKVLKVDKNGKFGDKYYIDPSTFDRPGTMGLYNWEYVAILNSNEEVYEVECVLPQQTFSIIAKEGEPKGPGLDLFPAIRAVYPNSNSTNPLEFTVEAKDGYNIDLKAKQYRRGLDIDLVWEANVRIYHPETSMKLFQEQMDRDRKDVLKKNEGF